MFLKVVSVLLVLEIIGTYGVPEKFMIKNKETGMVLDGSTSPLGIGYWSNKKSQLWTLQPHGNSGRYIILNVGNGQALDACPSTRAILTWAKHAGRNQQWGLQTNARDTRIDVLFYPNEFLVHKGGKLQLQRSKQTDDTDKWLLVEPF